MADTFVLHCTVNPGDGQPCPEGAETWQAFVQHDPWAMPSAEEFRQVFDASVVAFLFPTLILAFLAWGVRKIVEQVA